MKDLKPKFELVEGQNSQKAWNDNEPLRKEMSNICHKEAQYELDKEAVKWAEHGLLIEQANKKSKANIRKSNRLFSKQRKERDENITSKKQICKRSHQKGI